MNPIFKVKINGEWVEIPALVGPAGKGVSKAVINNDGELEFTYTDNTTVNVGKVIGSNGDDYVLTEADKQEIARMVVALIPIYEGEVDIE